ncbi:unnamed protein product [Amaranthus hypochondriacus]
MAIHNRIFFALLFMLAPTLDCLNILFVKGEVQMKGNCSYVITIETSCSKDAGTSDYISLRFGDSTNDVLIRPLNRRRVKRVDTMGQNVLDDVPRRPFQPCSVDEFQVDKPCVDTPICYLYLKLTGSDDWRPGFAQVRVQDEARFNSNYFYFRRYLPRHVWHGYDLCDREVTPFGIKHKRKVFH